MTNGPNDSSGKLASIGICAEIAEAFKDLFNHEDDDPKDQSLVGRRFVIVTKGGPYDSSGHPPRVTLSDEGPYDGQVVGSSPHDGDDGCSSTGGIG